MGVRNRHWLRIACVAAAMLAGQPDEVFAQAQTTYVEGVKQGFVAQLAGGPPGGWYNSVEEAFAAHQAWQTNPANCGPGFVCTVDNLHPCANQTHYNWGQPGSWCWHYRKTLNGQPYSEGITGTIGWIATCPTDPYYNSVTNLVSGTGTIGDPRYYENRCERSKTPILPKACGFGNPIYPASGTKRQVEQDYASANGSLSFARHYHSAYGRFRHEYDVDFVSPDQKFGSGCVGGEIRIYDSRTNSYLKFPRCFAHLNPSQSGSKAQFIGLDGARDEHSWNGSAGSSTAPYFKNRLARADVNGAPGWLMTRPDENRLLAFDASGRLQYVQRIDGSRVTLGYSGNTLSMVTDDWGRTLQVTQDANGVTGFTDPAGQRVSYSYAGVNKMTRVTYPDGSTKTYLWDEATHSIGSPDYVNRLTGIVDELGKRFASFGYSYGKAVSTEYAGGANRFSISDTRSSGAGNIVLTDPLGTAYRTTYSVINGLSLPTSSNQPAGSGCAAATSQVAYDANTNRASVDDLNGKRTCHANDLSRNVETTRVEGLLAGATCSTYTAVNAALPTGSRKTTTRWHPDWQLKAGIAEPGRITTYVYNGQPDPFNGNAAASCAPADALLPDGKPTAVLCKKVEQATVDANGAQGFAATLQPGVATREWQWTYNVKGQVLTERDPLNNQTAHVYYASTTADYTAGDLQRVTNAAGHATQYLRYNKHGQVLRTSDANGVVTDYTYDLRQRLTMVASAGQTTSYEYDAVGQLRRVTAPDASYVAYDYDDAHRLVAVSDSRGNRIDYTLDNAGNRTAEQVRDPGGALKHQLARAIDALGRVQQTTGRE